MGYEAACEAVRNQKLKGMILPEDTMKNMESRCWKKISRVCGPGGRTLGVKLIRVPDDDVTSVDHDFGPGFCLWLTRKTIAVGQALQRAYTELPVYMGFPARNDGAGW